MIMMPYGSPSSLQLKGRAHFWHPTGSCAMHSSTRAWLVRKLQLATFWKLSRSF
jgi:hypothetical protein